MLESAAIVVSVRPGEALVEAEAPGSCGGAACGPQGCGTAVLVRMFSQRRRAFQAANPIDAQVGERVVVGLAEETFLKSALLAYLAPLVAVLVGAVIGTSVAPAGAVTDLYGAGGAVLGLVFGFAALRHGNRRLVHGAARAVILRRA